MSLSSDVVVDLDGNFAVVGGQRIAAVRVDAHESAPSHQGACRIQVGGESGPILRPLLFGERLNEVSAASQSDDPPGVLATLIAQCATCRAGDQDPEVVAAVALHLAGAGETDLPFDETVSAVLRNTEIPLDEIARYEASWIDRMAASTVADARQEDGWNRIVFVTEPKDDQDTRAILRRLADSLLVRFRDTSILNSARPADPSIPSAEALPLHSDKMRQSPTTRNTQVWQPFQSEAINPGVTQGNPQHTAQSSPRLDEARAIRLGNTAFGIVSPPATVISPQGQQDFLSSPVADVPGDAGEVIIPSERSLPVGVARANSPSAEPGESTTTGIAGGWGGAEWASGPRWSQSPETIGISERSSIRRGSIFASDETAPVLRHRLQRTGNEWSGGNSEPAPRVRHSAKPPPEEFDLEDVADELALRLQHESDLRGIDP